MALSQKLLYAHGWLGPIEAIRAHYRSASCAGVVGLYTNVVSNGATVTVVRHNHAVKPTSVRV